MENKRLPDNPIEAIFMSMIEARQKAINVNPMILLLSSLAFHLREFFRRKV